MKKLPFQNFVVVDTHFRCTNTYFESMLWGGRLGHLFNWDLFLMIISHSINLNWHCQSWLIPINCYKYISTHRHPYPPVQKYSLNWVGEYKGHRTWKRTSLPKVRWIIPTLVTSSCMVHVLLLSKLPIVSTIGLVVLARVLLLGIRFLINTTRWEVLF